MKRQILVVAISFELMAGSVGAEGILVGQSILEHKARISALEQALASGDANYTPDNTLPILNSSNIALVSSRAESAYALADNAFAGLQVSSMGIADNTAAIQSNRARIDSVSALAGNNSYSIALLSSTVATGGGGTGENVNSQNIMVNSSNIATNSSNIMTSSMNTAVNSANISMTESNIMILHSNTDTNSQYIQVNSNNIAVNSMNVMVSSSNVSVNSMGVAVNSTNIQTNSRNIGTNSANIGTLSAVITTATSSDLAAANTMVGVSVNSSNIQTNSVNIAVNSGNIGINSLNNQVNSSNISSLSSTVYSMAARPEYRQVRFNAASMILLSQRMEELERRLPSRSGKSTRQAGEFLRGATVDLYLTALIGENGSTAKDLKNIEVRFVLGEDGRVYWAEPETGLEGKSASTDPASGDGALERLRENMDLADYYFFEDRVVISLFSQGEMHLRLSVDKERLYLVEAEQAFVDSDVLSSEIAGFGVVSYQNRN